MIDDAPPAEERPDDGDTALAAEFVLRLLGPAEAAACAAREARDPGFAARVAAWREQFAGLDAAFAPAEPPRRLQARIEARLFGAAPSRLARVWESVGLWRVVAAAAVLAAVYLGTLGPPLPVGVAPDGEARLVSALASVNSDVQLLAVFEPQAAVLNVNRLSGAPAEGRALELWVALGDGAPTSLGVLPDAPQARIPLTRELAERVMSGDHFAISDEPPGGSPTGAPTGAVVALGNITEL